jgi:hypothetical protein
MVREADRAAKEYDAIVHGEKSQKWKDSTLVFLVRY